MCEEDGTLYRVVCVLGDGGHLGMVYGVRRMRPGQGEEMGSGVYESRGGVLGLPALSPRAGSCDGQ